MFHGWIFDPDGDQAAADSTRSSNSLETGSSLNPRTARRLVTASYTSIIAYLSQAIALPVLKHSETREQANLSQGALSGPRYVRDHRLATSVATEETAVRKAISIIQI